MWNLRVVAAGTTVMVGLLAGGTERVWAQNGGEHAPTIVSLQLSTTACSTPTLWTPFVDPPLVEGQVLYVCLQIQDLDWTADEEGNANEEQIVLITMESTWVPFIRNTVTYGPEPPPVPTDRTGTPNDEQNSGYYTAFAPPTGNITSRQLVFLVPEFSGRNQARLRGFISYDVRWRVRITVRNTTSSDQNFEPYTLFFTVLALEDPTLVPGNPPPLADAGADLTTAVGNVVTLDGSLSFDRANTGFSPFDPEVFDKDMLRYTWEWISGPERVDPVPDPNRPANVPAANWPIALVTLNEVTTPENPYVYRLAVEDGVNALPSTDLVSIFVLSALPFNHPPAAVIVKSPDGPATVGTQVRLSAASSSDPDGDSLSYRWRQTNAVGGDLMPDEVRSGFQPLSGITSAVASWVATTPGTYYFGLLVTDPGGLTDSALVSVEVVAASGSASARENVSPTAAPRDVLSETNTSNTAPPAAAGCGAGGLLPLAVLPALLWLMRGRLR